MFSLKHCTAYNTTEGHDLPRPVVGWGCHSPMCFFRDERSLAFHQRCDCGDCAQTAEKQKNDDAKAARLLFRPRLGMCASMTTIAITATTQDTHDSLSSVRYEHVQLVHREGRAAPQNSTLAGAWIETPTELHVCRCYCPRWTNPVAV
jgi:hypothetical protein